MPGTTGIHAGPRYRPDIDGLRGVAVLLVILFHLGSRFHGGFIGVDVFFVISGYLITAVLCAEIASGRFTLSGFYTRRIRRILPALLVMMAVTTVLAWRFLIPAELESFGRSERAALLSVSNLLFRSQAGYFDSPNVFKPLLHTWSLGVEEQFYLAFPLFLLFVTRFFPRQLRSILCGLALVSFIASVNVVARDPNTAFYLAPLRAWELLLGAIVSRNDLPSIRGPIARNFASAAGLLVILAAALNYTGGTPFPGAAALPPCLGAALILAAGESGPSLIGSVLSTRPIVFLGLISYSLYLWHWPLLVFQRSDAVFVPQAAWNVAAKALFLLLLILVATLSWAFVEQPFRSRHRMRTSIVFRTAGPSFAALLLVSAALSLSRGFPTRFPPSARQIGAYATYDRSASTRDGTCFLQPANTFADFRPNPCLLRHAGRRSILLAGDSHAAALFAGLARVFPDRDILQANVSSCRPAVVEPPGVAAICAQLNAFLFSDYIPTHTVDTLLLAAKWSASDLDSLAETIRFAQSRGIHVILVGPGIEYDQAMPRLLAIALRSGDTAAPALHRDPEPQRLDAVMARLALTRWHVPYISIYGDLCRPQCPLYAAAGVPLLFDSHHFTSDGATLLAQAMRANHQVP